jgi:N-acetylglucosamine kinase-like BadF-type ATPase
LSLLAFDVGQTGTRLRLCEDRGSTIQEVVLPGRKPRTDINSIVLSLVSTATTSFSVTSFTAVSGGVTGMFGHVEDLSELGRILWNEYGTARLAVADDGVTSYLGALGKRPGVVAAVGTGIVTLGLGTDNRFRRVEGLGAFIGDEGAGWWIGKHGLLAAFKALDDRPGASPALLQAATKMFGPLERLPGELMMKASPVAEVARFAEQVAILARSGDVVALSIWERAAVFIAQSIIDAATGARLTEPLNYSLVGRIASALDLLEPTISNKLSAHFANVKRLVANGESIDGAVLLAQDESLEDFSPMVAQYRHYK